MGTLTEMDRRRTGTPSALAPARDSTALGVGRIDAVLVVVPARDEARRIGATIDALEQARAELATATEATVTASFVIVADGCRDATAAVARLRLRGDLDLVVEGDWRCVGRARAEGTAVGLARTDHPPARIWVASTDADTVVPGSWLVDHLRAAAAGQAALAGTVRLLDDADATPRIQDRFARWYPVAADGRHHHVHAANLGVRADAYLAVGGWRSLRVGEEHDLWRRLLQDRWPVQHREDPWVYTSARRRGRAPRGFAADMAALDADARGWSA